MATQVEERIWTVEGAKKRAAVQKMFAEIAPAYDRFNHLVTMSLHHKWRRAAVAGLNLQPGDHVLDVCCGTGDFLIELRKAIGATGHAAGVDFCAEMLTLAQKKTEGQAQLSLGDACDLPYGSGKFDAVTVGWGIRNVPDADAAHREIARVLRPGGRFVSLDMARPRNPLVRAVSEFMTLRVCPFIGSIVGKSQAYTYLPKSAQLFHSRERLAASMESAGLVDVGYRDFLFGNICLHFGRKPFPGENPGVPRV